MHPKTLPAAMALTAFAAAVTLTACAILAPFNQYSFDETARLKVESIDLLKKARESYGLHETKADSVLAGIQSAYRDAMLRSKNDESMRQWEILLDPEQGSLAGALRQWKQSDRLPAATIAAFRKTVANNFDLISRLEGGKGR